MVKEKREQNKSFALKAKKESNDEDSSTYDSEDEDTALAYTSSSGPNDPLFVKSSADNLEVSITGNKPKLSGAEDFTLSNHGSRKVPSNESQVNITDHSLVVSESLVTDYDSADESSVCSTLLPPLEKLTGAKPVSGPKTIKSILKLKSTFKAEMPSKNVKIEDDPPLAIAIKELNDLKLQISKNKSSYSRTKTLKRYFSFGSHWNEVLRHVSHFGEETEQDYEPTPHLSKNVSYVAGDVRHKYNVTPSP
ncbi:hypothetical protein Tco_0474090 [Tanacetum coccineum]